MKYIITILIFALLVMALLLIADQIANAEGFGRSVEGDSASVTVTLNNGVPLRGIRRLSLLP
jgi:hypothetical protein